MNQLDDEPRGYLAIDLETGGIFSATSLVVIPWGDDLVDEEDSEAVLALVEVQGEIPVAPEDIREIEEPEFESVAEEEEDVD